MKLVFLCAALSLLGAAGVAQAQQVGTLDSHNNGLMDAKLDQRAVKKVQSKFSKDVQYVGSQYVVDYPCKGFLCTGDWAIVRLSATRGPAGAVYQLIITINYRDDSWREYQTVAFVGGDTESLVSTRGDVSNCDSDDDTCSYVEYVGAPLTRAFLDAHAKSGFEVQISGNGNQNTVPVPAPYVQGFLAAVPDGPSSTTSIRPVTASSTP